MANIFTIPNRIVAGEGALRLAGAELPAFGKKALIVTDPMMVKLGNTDKVTGMLDSMGIEHAIYDGITGEPNHEMIDRGVEVYQESGCDFLMAIGGGSPIDSMKAIAAVVANGGSICDYVGKTLVNPMPPTCAIPTTAGTGSEATSVTIITNLHTQVKMMIKDPALMVRMAIVDPQFTMTAPPSVTASSHSLEVPSPGTSRARWENQLSAAAPCQCFTSGGILTTSPGLSARGALPHS